MGIALPLPLPSVFLNNVIRDFVINVALSIVHINFLKKFNLKMAPDGRAETCS